MIKAKPIEIMVYETKEILGVFKSTKYVTDNSKILFGKEFKQANISKVVLGKSNQYYGLSIKYISEEEYNKRKDKEEPKLELIYKIELKEKNIDNNSKVKDSNIDISNLPKKKWAGRIVVDWINTKGYDLNITYKGKEYILNIIDSYRDNNKTSLTLEYNGKIQKLSTSQILSCNFGELLGLSNNNGNHKYEFIYNIGDIINNLLITDTKRIALNNGHVVKAYKYKCLKCGFDCSEHYDLENKKYKKEGFLLQSNLLQGKGCVCCSNKVIVKGINDIATTNPELVKYFVNIDDAYTHTYGSGDKVLCKCPICGYKKEVSIHNLKRKGFGCPKCGDGISYPNKFMFNLLEQLGLEFQTEYCPQWIDKSKYDFYIPSMKLIIEMDGNFHYINNKMNGQTAEKSKKIDNRKDKLAKEHGFKVIRINCNYYDISKRFEYVKENTIKSLKDIFDFNNIDWDSIDYQSNINNLLLKVCKLKHDNHNLTASQISELLKPQNSCSKSTIIKWLRLGNKIGLCEYDIDKEKGIKYVEMFKNNISFGIFKNIHNLEKHSEKLFGIKLNTQGISRACLNNKPYKGYTFKYISREEYERRISEDPTLKESEQAS